MPKKFERCVKKVKKSLRKYKRKGNAYAICNASINKRKMSKTRKPLKRRKTTSKRIRR